MSRPLVDYDSDVGEESSNSSAKTATLSPAQQEIQPLKRERPCSFREKQPPRSKVRWTGSSLQTTLTVPKLTYPSELILPEDLMMLVLRQADFQTLATLSLTCRTLHRLAICDQLWEKLWRRTFRASPPESSGALPRGEAHSLPAGVQPTWRNQFRYSLERRRRRMKQLHTRRVLRLESDLMVANSEHAKLLSNSAREKQRHAELVSELADLTKLTTVETASQVWQPSAICNHHQRLLEQRPTNTASHRERHVYIWRKVVAPGQPEHNHSIAIQKVVKSRTGRVENTSDTLNQVYSRMRVKQQILETRLHIRRLNNQIKSTEMRQVDLKMSLRTTRNSRPWLELSCCIDDHKPDGIKED